jgi:hypothetical protein
MSFDVKFSESNSSFEAGFDIKNKAVVVRNDHALLENRDEPGQHPMSAITGLEEALGEKQPTGDYITEAELKTVTDEALAQAKASGEFDGHSPVITSNKTSGVTVIYLDGKVIAEVYDGKPGTTPEITTTKTNGVTTILVNGVAIAEIKDGADGTTPSITATKSGAVTTISVDGKVVAEIKDGTTPTKGTDYWTEADKTEIVEDTKEAIDLSSYAKTDDVPTNVSQLTNDSKFIDASGAPVQSVNGMTGNVVVDTEASVCEGVVLPNIEYPEFAIETIILKQYLILAESPNYVDIIAELKDETNNTIVWYSDIYTALTDINAGVVTNGSSTEISTGVKVMKLGELKYTNAPAKIFILQLLADITLTETLYIDTECVIDLNGHTIAATCSSGRNYMLVSGQNSESPEFAVTIYGMKSGSAITLTGDESITTEYYGGMYLFTNAYVSIIGGSYTIDVGSTPIYGQLLATMPMDRTKNSEGKYDLVGSTSVTELRNATFKLSASPTDVSRYWVGLNLSTDSIYIDGCIIDYNCNAILFNATAIYAAQSNRSTSPRTSICCVKNSTVTAYSKPNSSIQSAIGIMGFDYNIFVRNSTVHAANCAIEGSCNVYVSDSVLEGGEHGGIYTSAFGSSRYTTIGNDSYADYTRLDIGEGGKYYIQNTILRKLDGTGSPHNNLYSCYFGCGPVYCNNVTFDSYNGQYNRPALKYDGTTAYLSNCSLSDIRVDANCKAVFGAGIPDTVRNASVSGTIVNKPTEVYSAVISRDVGGLMNQVIDRVRQNEEAIEKLAASPTTVTKQSVVDALGYTPAAIGNPEDWALVQTATVTDANTSKYAFTFADTMEELFLFGTVPDANTGVYGTTFNTETDAGVAPSYPYYSWFIQGSDYKKSGYLHVWCEDGIVKTEHVAYTTNGTGVMNHINWCDKEHLDTRVRGFKSCSCYRGVGFPVGTIINVYGKKLSDVSTDAASGDMLTTDYDADGAVKEAGGIAKYVAENAGTGSGDMKQSDYDADGAVKSAGGIVAYAAGMVGVANGIAPLDASKKVPVANLPTSDSTSSSSTSTVATSSAVKAAYDLAKSASDKAGSGISVSGAAVGQTVKISAVDESGVPTAWEAVDRTWTEYATYNVKDLTFPAVMSIPQGKDVFFVLDTTDITADSSTKVKFSVITARNETGYAGRFGVSETMYAHTWHCYIRMLLLWQEGTQSFWPIAQIAAGATAYPDQTLVGNPIGGDPLRKYFYVTVDDASKINTETTAEIKIYVRDCL